MSLDLKPADGFSSVTIPFGFKFPTEQLDLSTGTENSCKIFGPETLECGTTENGDSVDVQIVGALLGEAHRDIVPHTYSHMGIWLAKDFIRIERRNEILEDVFGGQYYYRALLLFANYQSFDLTANRNNIRTDQEEYDLAIAEIKEYCRTIWEDEFFKHYFKEKREEDATKKRSQDESDERKGAERAAQRRRGRVNNYKGRANATFSGVTLPPVKEPSSEAETALLLQAMISSKHPGIDFVIGDYNTTFGVDLIVEMIDKDIPTIKWAELVSSLDKLYAWSHPPEGFHMIICYQLGKVGEKEKFQDGSVGTLVRKESPGKYALLVGSQTIDVYVLREILHTSKDEDH